uniref:C2H2-type domain-containing protein n=1 Tax=Anabas testudineus TaxID=64144 RepID=A0A3Q1IXU4_ANATE
LWEPKFHPGAVWSLQHTAREGPSENFSYSSKFYSSSASSIYASNSDGRFSSSTEREHNMQSIPGLGDSDYSNKPLATESSRPKYTSESAANILLHFGLEKEDLEHLISYPEDQITPANLPFILRQIRMRQEMPSDVLQPSKVIDYGHTGKYTGGVGDEIGRTSGSRPNSSGSGNTLLTDAYSSSHSREQLKNKPTEVRSSALGSSHTSSIHTTYRIETGKRELSSVAQIQPVAQMGNVLWPPVYSAVKPMPVPPASLNPTIPVASHAMARSVFVSGAPCPIVIPTAPPQPIPSFFIRTPMPTPTPTPTPTLLSNRQPPAKVAVSRGLPTPVMMHDYAAASPRVFPHTCSLCNKECAHMKDWISHQNTSLHLESCKLLRAQSVILPFIIVLGKHLFCFLHKPPISYLLVTKHSAQSLYCVSVRLIPILFSSQGQDDFTNDDVSSHAYLFDDLDFNMEDFVTVDEVGDDIGDTSPGHRSSSSRRSSRGTRERRSSDYSSPAKRVSTRSSKDSKNSASSSSSSSASSSSSSRLAKSSMKSSPSSESTSVLKDLSEHKVSKTSVPSSPLSPETPSSLAQKQKSKTKSPGKASAEVVETSEETVLHREKAKTTESAVTKFDQRVSAKGSAAKSVESETKIDSSSEMQPPPHETVLKSQSQSLHNDDVLKENKTNTERKEDADKHPKQEEDDGENYQILDSLDEQTDEGDHSITHLPEYEDGQSLQEKSFQVLDSVEDEGRTCPEDNSEMEMDNSFQVIDSISEEQEATDLEEHRLVKDEASTGKNLTEEDVNQDAAIKDTVAKDQEANKEENLQILDTDSKEGNTREHTEREVKDRILTEQSSNDDLQNEDQLLDNTTIKELDSDVNEQETFEILDSIDEQTETEDNSPKPEAPSDQMSKVCVRPATTETDSETDGKDKGLKKDEGTTRKDDKGPSKRSSTRTVKKYETRTKAGTTAGASKTGKNITEEMVFEIVDAVEEEPHEEAEATQRSVRRRSARGKREEKTPLNITEMSEKAAGDEEATYKILDSVDDETGNDEATITTRSTRGRREKTVNKDAPNEKTRREDTPTRRRHTPARDSREKTPKQEEKTSPTKKCDITREVSEKTAMHEMFHSVEDEVKEVQPATKGRGRRGRPKKSAEITKEDTVTLKHGDRDASDKVADEEEETYQVLDSVEDEAADDKPPAEQSQNERKENTSENDDQRTERDAPTTEEEEEEEPVYQIVDSLEEDQVQEESVATEAGGRKMAKEVEAPTEMPACGVTVVEASGQVTIQAESPDRLADIHDDHSLSDAATPGQNATQKSHNRCNTAASANTLVNLDEVSEEEDDYPDDTAEKEELRRRQAATKEKQLAKDREKGPEERKTRGRDERERRSRSRSGTGGGGGGRGSDGGAARRTKDKGSEREEKLEVETKELLTLDEVGADEGGEERLAEGQEWDADIMEGELQALVTLDEIVEEEEGNAEHSTLEADPPCQEEASVESLNPEVRLIQTNAHHNGSDCRTLQNTNLMTPRMLSNLLQTR